MKSENEMEESPFREEPNGEMKGIGLLNVDSDIFQLFSSQKKFDDFVVSCGEAAEIPLSENNYRYSR